MPLYDFRCVKCGLEFEVSRPVAKAGEPAFCPMDGGECERTHTTPGTFFQSAHAEGRGRMPQRPQGAPWQFDRSHGPGGHSHGPGAPWHTH